MKINTKISHKRTYKQFFCYRGIIVGKSEMGSHDNGPGRQQVSCELVPYKKPIKVICKYE